MRGGWDEAKEPVLRTSLVFEGRVAAVSFPRHRPIARLGMEVQDETGRRRVDAQRS